MSHRTLSWTKLSRSLHNSRPAIAPGLLSAKARIDMTVRTTRRPLFAAGQFDRAAIMSAASSAAHAHQERFGGTWSEAMSVALKAAWGAAKLARHMAAH
ncbi:MULTISPECIES: hypothetical protein [unclassified Methylobacterium]|uniref:hypothetical protein n=1 Tax=unclassified Methylobacterium TaxID=2615210 RepID=UPI001FBB625E|nr:MULTISPECIES: hypothetical protein [unclassified Methylobacterium]MCJ2092080.1 hypothetical protein [Methylobacterium sp. J-072]MCJ2139506.1 hypothetical protein [Methylobacterium sp. E-066]